MSDFNIKIPPIQKLPSVTQSISSRFIDQVDEMAKQIEREKQEKFEREETFKKAVINHLANIDKNTDNLSAIVNLIRTSNERQEELLGVLNSINEISTAKTLEDADSLYRKALRKASSFNNDMNTFTTLWTQAKMVWDIAKKFIENPPF